MEENFNKFEHENEHKHCHCKENCFKYALMFFATLLGAFLAFYFVADYTLKMMFSPEYHMRHAEKMIRQMDKNIEKELNRDFSRDFDKEIKVIGKSMQTPVEISENNNSYIVTVTLKPFGNNAKNVKVSVEDDNILKIEGSNEVKKGGRENMINLMQAYKLQKKVDKEKITTKEEHGNYIVTIPFIAQ